LALAESSMLLSISGRRCSNGVAVPTKDPAWVAFVQEVRDAGMQAYKAAQAKDQDKMIETAETLDRSCAGCHRKFRDRKAPENRCK
jgi:mono/diheme cytochrome c family protein